jgi:hypothetical protein
MGSGAEMPPALAVGRDRPRRFRLSQRSDGPLVLDVLLDLNASASPRLQPWVERADAEAAL